MSSNVSNQNPVEQVAEMVQVAPTEQATSLVAVENDQVVTTSLKIADIFGKRHKHVLEAIKTMECSEEFRETNFRPSEFTYQNGNIKKQLPMYYITRDGFMFLVMGFTGKTAAKYKEAYIKAFNDMEEKLRAEQMKRAIEEHDRKEAIEYEKLLEREEREEAEVDRRVEEYNRQRIAAEKERAKAEQEAKEQAQQAEQQPQAQAEGGIIEVVNGKRVVTSHTLARLTGRKHFHVMESLHRTLKYADRPSRSFIKSGKWAINKNCLNTDKYYYITEGGFRLLSKRTRFISTEVSAKVMAAFSASKRKNVGEVASYKAPTTPPTPTAKPQPTTTKPTAQTPTVANMPQTLADLMQRFVKAMGVMMGVDTNEMFNLTNKGE